MDTSFVNREDIIYEDDLIEQNDISSESEEDTEIYTMKHENKEAAFSDIRYSMGRPDGQNKTTSSYLGNIAIKLKEMEHKSVDPDSDLRLKINHELSTNKENTTFAVYLADMYKMGCNVLEILVKDDVDLDLLSQLLNGQYEVRYNF
ncbi:hypothetical protein RhiirC2_775785 [Rhizophagus irregularis]|uniref:Uncharacterized protein n=1 Tax=Rhizophagus irregularis TaxID=588596 RepID=A0A2N1NIF9_9GLOM|nr:hypothetical protein RhiirC2_775785 [Rhizophagus irregularis]